MDEEVAARTRRVDNACGIGDGFRDADEGQPAGREVLVLEVYDDDRALVMLCLRGSVMGIPLDTPRGTR